MADGAVNRFFVLTGGPGGGKSALAEALRKDGFTVMPEAGRAVIRAQTAAGGDALPWKDRAAFARLMYERDLRNYREAEALPGKVLFDRGLPDMIGYLRLCDLPVWPGVSAVAEAMRYNRCVFITPPWREIFVNDAERKQDFAEAEATYRAMTQVYAELGYALIPLPLAPVEERVRFILDHTANA
jgi:predicted ATPase